MTNFQKNNLLRISLFLLTFIMSQNLWAQVKTVTGTITNDKDEPLAGATVSVKGKNRTVTTDIQGNFSINAEAGEVLIVSSVGFTRYEIKITEDTNYAAKLTANSAGLDAVTVIGSRGKPRTDVNRPVPVDVISSKELENTGQTDLGQMAQFTSPSFNSAKNGINGVANHPDKSVAFKSSKKILF